MKKVFLLAALLVGFWGCSSRKTPETPKETPSERIKNYELSSIETLNVARGEYLMHFKHPSVGTGRYRRPDAYWPRPRNWLAFREAVADFRSYTPNLKILVVFNFPDSCCYDGLPSRVVFRTTPIVAEADINFVEPVGPDVDWIIPLGHGNYIVQRRYYQRFKDEYPQLRFLAREQSLLGNHLDLIYAKEELNRQ